MITQIPCHLCVAPLLTETERLTYLPVVGGTVRFFVLDELSSRWDQGFPVSPQPEFRAGKRAWWFSPTKEGQHTGSRARGARPQACSGALSERGSIAGCEGDWAEESRSQARTSMATARTRLRAARRRAHWSSLYCRHSTTDAASESRSRYSRGARARYHGFGRVSREVIVELARQRRAGWLGVWDVGFCMGRAPINKSRARWG